MFQIRRIVVAVKQVATLDEDFELLDDGTGVDPDFLEWELNEWDRFSLEAALQLADAAGGDPEVVAATVGDEEAEEALLAGLAMGAHRAIRVWDDALEGADALAVARTLAAVLAREPPDLLLCGAQSSDAMNGATGVALAAQLGLPYAAVVRRLAIEGDALVVERELEGGLVQLLRLPMPAAITVQTGINEPRYATLRAIKQARDKPLEVLDLAGLGLDERTVAAAAGSRTRALRHRERGRGAQMLDGSPADVAARIAEIVKDRLGR